MAPPRRSERLARELAHNPAVEVQPEHESPFVLRHLCDLADEKMKVGDRDCLRVARFCCRIANRLQTDEARALAFGRLASALRLVDRLGHSARALEIALETAPRHLEGDLLRRRCYRLLYQRRFASALVDAKAAVESSSGADRARALGVLGIVFGCTGKIRTAIEVHARCLGETNPDDEIDFCNAIQNYVTSLAKGTDDEVRKALALCAKARTRLKRRHRLQRAKLWWTTGLLHLRLGGRKAAWSALDTARRSLIALELAPEVAAIIGDMARIDPEPFAIRHLCQEAAQVIAGRHPLTRPLRALACAAREVIPQAAAALREEAGRLASCPAL